MSTRNLSNAAAAALAHPPAPARYAAASRDSPRRRRGVWLGLLVALLGVGAAFALTRREAAPVHVEGSTLAIDTWVWHFDPELAQETAPFYRDLLLRLPADTKILVMVADAQAEALARDALGERHAGDKRLRFVMTHAPIGAWARDFYTPFDFGGTPSVLGFPRAAILPREQGVLKVPGLLASAHPGLSLVPARQALVGGDLLLSAKRVLVGASSVRRLVGDDAAGHAQLRKDVESAFGRRLLVIGEGPTAPYFHLDMFLTIIDDEHVVLGDPTLAVELLKTEWNADGELRVRNQGTFRKETQERLVPLYRSIERELQAAGFSVQRMPILHGERPVRGDRPETVLNWNNVVLERREGRNIAYIPRCGLKILDAEAARLWRSLGYEVHAIDCSRTIGQGGAVHCLTNDLRGLPTPVSAAPGT